MKKKLGVFLIRGAGKRGSKEQEKFVNKLNKLLIRSDIDPGRIHYEYADWYGPTQDNQELLFRRFKNSGADMKAWGLRKFALYLISDTVAYVGEPHKRSTTYHNTHRLIHKSILNMKEQLEEDAPLIIIGSSLGTEIISNYIRDRQLHSTPDPLGKSPFERMETLTGIFMFGNNNAIYISAYEIDDVKPFQFPPGQLADKYKKIAYWGNFYDRDDPLGYPLKPINQHYREMVTEDVQINAGNLLTSWNAASHLGYWKSGKLRKRVAAYLKKVLAVT